jgi:hypothetical protein
MIAESEKFIEQASDAIDRRDAADLEYTVIKSAEYVFQSGPSNAHFDDSILRFIIDNLSIPKFLEMNVSNKLLLLLLYDWANLSTQQRERLMEPLEQAFFRFVDWMSRFIIVELLGEHFESSKALDALIRLLQSAKGSDIGLIVHGINNWGKLGSSEEIRQRAERALAKLGS